MGTLLIRNILQTEIRGFARFLVIGTLAGIVVGTIGGCLYGYALERPLLEDELIAANQGLTNYRLDANGQLPSKISGHIRSQCRGTGLRLGLPIGAAAGLLIGISSWWVIRPTKPGDPTKIKVGNYGSQI